MMDDIPRTHGYRSAQTPDDASIPATEIDISPPLTPQSGIATTATSTSTSTTSQHQPSRDNCDRRRPKDGDEARVFKMPSSELVGMAVSPFLKEHIPGIYAPIGKGKQDQSTRLTALPTPIPRKVNSNSKFCYRHRPDSKCRRAADETKMGMIQSVRNRSTD